MNKPSVKLIGTDGNIFSIMGKVSKELKRNGMNKEASEYTEKVFACQSYNEALQITMQYVNVR